MLCPFCGDESNRVIDSRLGRDGTEIRRRRECEECGRRFTTRERIEEIMPRIVKRDGRREEYDRGKLRAGIQRACSKRPISENAIERLLDRLERRLQEGNEREMPSRVLGERALEELSALDPMAAARFASVFSSFEKAEDYARFFESVARSAAPSEQDDEGG